MGKASRKKKAKQRSIPQSSKSGPWGFDYGVSVSVATISPVNFNQKLQEAEVVAMAYGSTYSDEVKRSVPILSLIGRNEAPLREAFQEFARWREGSDADAVDLTIVFGKASGYTIIICPDSDRLINRTVKHDPVVDAISFQIGWVKPIDSVSAPLSQIRAFLEHGIRPFILSAATYSGLTTPGAFLPELFRPVPGLQSLLKFKIRFVDEGADKDKHWQSIARLANKRIRKGQRRRSEAEFPNAGALFRSRANRLKTLFPVTLWRAEISENIGRTMEEAEKCGLLHWQVQQALCNVLLSREVGEFKPHFMGIARAEWPQVLVSRLRQRHELANGELGPAEAVSAKEIVQQAILDAGVLLRVYSVRTLPNDINSVQAALKKLGLLEPWASDDISSNR